MLPLLRMPHHPHSACFTVHSLTVCSQQKNQHRPWSTVDSRQIIKNSKASKHPSPPFETALSPLKLFLSASFVFISSYHVLQLHHSVPVIATQTGRTPGQCGQLKNEQVRGTVMRMIRSGDLLRMQTSGGGGPGAGERLGQVGVFYVDRLSMPHLC